MFTLISQFFEQTNVFVAIKCDFKKNPYQVCLTRTCSRNYIINNLNSFHNFEPPNRKCPINQLTNNFGAKTLTRQLSIVTKVTYSLKLVTISGYFPFNVSSETRFKQRILLKAALFFGNRAYGIDLVGRYHTHGYGHQ